MRIGDCRVVVCRQVVDLAQVRRRWSQKRIPRFRYPTKPTELTGEVLLRALSVTDEQKKKKRTLERSIRLL